MPLVPIDEASLVATDMAGWVLIAITEPMPRSCADRHDRVSLAHGKQRERGLCDGHRKG